MLCQWHLRELASNIWRCTLLDLPFGFSPEILHQVPYEHEYLEAPNFQATFFAEDALWSKLTSGDANNEKDILLYDLPPQTDPHDLPRRPPRVRTPYDHRHSLQVKRVRLFFLSEETISTVCIASLAQREAPEAFTCIPQPIRRCGAFLCYNTFRSVPYRATHSLKSPDIAQVLPANGLLSPVSSHRNSLCPMTTISMMMKVSTLLNQMSHNLVIARWASLS
jgi:hypothetical protein